jgi:hypothetical protein
MAMGRKTGGRQKGSQNKVNVATRERIERECDPIGFMMRVVKGEAVEAALPLKDERDRIEKVQIFPTVEQRIAAAEYLGRKVMPDLKATEISTPVGQGRIKFVMELGNDG